MKGENSDSCINSKCLEERLWTALTSCNITLVQTLINKGADINDVNNRITPIFKAINMKCPSMVKLLIQHGCNVDYESADGYETPIFSAIRSGQLDIVKLLVDAGCDINHTVGYFTYRRPIHVAILLHEPIKDDIVTYLLEKKASLIHNSAWNGEYMDTLSLAICVSFNSWHKMNEHACHNVITSLLAYTAVGSEKHFSRLFEELDTDFLKNILRRVSIHSEFVVTYYSVSTITTHFTDWDYFCLFAQACSFHELTMAHVDVMKNTVHDQYLELFSRIKGFLSEPMDLQSICCQTIRKQVSDAGVWWCIDRLPLPMRLKDRLKLIHY